MQSKHRARRAESLGAIFLIEMAIIAQRKNLFGTGFNFIIYFCSKVAIFGLWYSNRMLQLLVEEVALGEVVVALVAVVAMVVIELVGAMLLSTNGMDYLSLLCLC